MSRRRAATWMSHAVVAATTALLFACGGGSDGSPSVASLLPDNFPVPAEARVIEAPGEGKGVVTLGVPGPTDEVLSFYERELPAQDWKLDPWEGTDPFGKPTGGFIMERGAQTAALSVTEADDGSVELQLNFHQPTQPKPGEGHGGGGAPASDPAHG
jgi:hypothetical protein